MSPAESSVPVVTLPGPGVVSHNPSFTPGLGHSISTQFPNLSIKLRVCVVLWWRGRWCCRGALLLLVIIIAPS